MLSWNLFQILWLLLCCIIVLHMKKAAQMFATLKGWIRFMKIYPDILVASHIFFLITLKKLLFILISRSPKKCNASIDIVYLFLRSIWSLIGWEYDIIKNSCYVYLYICIHLYNRYFRQLGRVCQVVYSNLDWEKASEKLISAVHVAFATRYISKTKIGLIGHQAPGFLDFYPNPFEMSKQLGSILQHVGMTEYISTALHLISDEEVSADIDYVVNNLKLPFKSLSTGFGVEQSELSQSSRHYLALRHFIQENNFDSLAIRCWPELPGPQV